MNNPSGALVWIWVTPKNIDQIIQVAKLNKINAVAIKAFDGEWRWDETHHPGQFSAGVIKQLKDAGLTVAGWWYSVGDWEGPVIDGGVGADHHSCTIDAELDNLEWMISQGIDFAIIDPEKEWCHIPGKRDNPEEHATRYLTRMRERIGDFPVYAGIVPSNTGYWEGNPLKLISQYCDGTMPQCYAWISGHPEQIEGWINSAINFSYGKPCYPILDAANNSGVAAASDYLLNGANIIKNRGLQGFSLWHWGCIQSKVWDLTGVMAETVAVNIQERGNAVKSFNVPYIHQVYDTPDKFNGYYACGPTSAVMALAYYGKLPAHPIHLSLGNRDSDFGFYVSEVYTNNNNTFDRTEPDFTGRMAAGAYGACIISPQQQMSSADLIRVYLTKNGLNSSFESPATFDTVKQALDKGNLVILSNNLTSGGHLILVTGYTDDGQIIANDPFGNANQPNYGHQPNGNQVRYKWSKLKSTPFMVVIFAAAGPFILIPIEYTVEINTPDRVNVRSGPGTSYPIFKTIQPDPTKRYQVDGEAHGESISSTSQPTGVDDCWSHIPELGGFISRALLTIVI